MSRAAQDACFAVLGYRPSGAQVCPRVVAGKRCRYLRSVWYDLSCICVEHRGVLDHARIWFAAPRHMLTSEPYDLKTKTEELAKFRAACEALGLEVIVGGYSPWNPRRTTLIRVVKR